MDMSEHVGKTVKVECLLREKLDTHYRFKYKMLLGDLFIEGIYWRDHTFVKYSKRWEKAKPGDTVQFTARVEPYRHDGRIKYGLRHVRNLKVFRAFGEAA